MAIKVECGECGREYNVKDELEGKKIRCKACSSTILVKSADEEEWDESIDEEEFLPPKKKKSTSKKKGRRRSSGGGMPGAIIVAIVCVGLMLCFSALEVIGLIGLISRLSQLRTPILIGALLGPLLRIISQVAVLMGLVKGSASTRIPAIILASLAAIVFSLQFFRRGGSGLGLDPAAEDLTIIILGVAVALRVTLIGCLLTPSANDHMRN